MSATQSVLLPGDPEWLKLMTASKVAAVLGVSKWDSPRSLWHKMRGDVPAEDATKIQKRGHYLEPAILNWFFDQHPEMERAGDVWLGTKTHANGWAAATPDAIALDPALDWFYPVEAKTAADDSEWGKPGTDEIPVGYGAQCMWTMHVLGAKRIYVPVLTTRLDFREYVVEYEEGLALDIERQCRAFMDSLDAAQPPALDDHVATYESLKRVNPSIVKDAEVQLDQDQARLFTDAVRAEKAAEARLLLAKSTVAEAMGTAQKAYYGAELIARRQNTASGIAAIYAAKPLPSIPEREAA